MEQRLSRVKGALRTIIAVEEDGYCKSNVIEALDVINHLEKEIHELRYSNAEKKLQIARIGQNIMNVSEEWGGGVVFYKKMRKYATDLMEAYNNDAE